MPVIGNDIVAINDAHNRASFSNPRYLIKTMTKSEKQAISIATQHPFLPFAIWSAKESAYKIMVKRGLKKSFCPIDFSVRFTTIKSNELKGRVSYFDHRVHVNSIVTPAYVHTIGTESENHENKQIFHGVKQIDEDSKSSESILTREFLKEDIQKRFGYVLGDLRIISDINTNVPLVQVNGRSLPIDLSLSHDSGYVSYAYVCE